MREQQRNHGQRAQILPLLAFGLVAIVGMLALVVDVGFWRYQQRLEQSAADSAAIAGAIRLNYPTTASSSTPQQVARAAAAQNGFTDDGGIGNVVVTPYIPPQPNAPPHTSATPYPPNSAVEVIVQTKNAQFFSGLFGNTFGSSSARAVAVAQPDFSACLWQLDLQGGFVTIKGNKPITTIGCGILANGTINVPGYSGTTSVGYWGPTNPGGIGAQSFPTAALPAPLMDPCPSIAGCAYLASQFAAGTVPAMAPTPNIDASKTTTVNVPTGQSAGYVTNCCTATTTFGPGLYYVYGGISGTIVGDAVTLVNVNGAFTASGLGAAHPYFTAPTSGPNAGIAYYQPPSNANAITFSGGGNGASVCSSPTGSTSCFDGLFYAPMATFTSNGGSVTFADAVLGNVRLNGGGKGLGLVVDPTLGGQTTFPPAAAPTHVVLSE